ncbi:MAG TPA: hypothetical protein VFG54_01870 [Prolixibacteraceae bacterium]|nr:hypothetical protein [Prolixibacteraceae bacterium]
MKTIDTTLLLTAIRKMAEHQPERLLRMSKEEPGELLKEIETRVTNAVGWTETAMGKGASQQKMKEMMNQLLIPDQGTENMDSIQISEKKVQEIYRKLMTFSR